MRYLRIFPCLGILFAVILAARPLCAQDNPYFETGLKPFGSYSAADFDTIDLSNGNLSLNIPLISYPQRGGKLKMDFELTYINQGYYYTVGYIYDPYGDFIGTTTSGGPNSQFPMWSVNLKGLPGAQETLVDTGYEYKATGQIIMTDGTVHQLAALSATGNWRASDASGFLATESTSTSFDFSSATDSDGVTYTPPGISIVPATDFLIGVASEEDTNGNQITLTGSGGYLTAWQDSVGRTIPAPARQSGVTGCPSTPATPTSSILWNLPGYNGGTYPILFCWGVSVSETQYYWNTNDNEQETFTFNSGPLLQSVVLPDGTAWTFNYSTDGNGNLAQVTSPTGGNLCYVIGELNQTYTDHFIAFPKVSTRKLDTSSCGTSSPTWTYGYAGGPLTTTVTDPVGNNTAHHFTMPTGTSNWYETETDYYQGSSSLVKTVDTTFTATGLVNAAVATQSTTIWPSGQQSEVQYSYDSGFTGGAVYQYYTGPPPFFSTYTSCCIYGKVVSQNEYDYGSGAPGSLLRTTLTAYQFQSNSNYLNNNLLNLPASVQVTGSGPGSYATYGYDETGCSSGTCGNLTSVHDWLNTTGGYLVTTNTYDSYGRIASTVDPKSNPATTYGYNSCYAGSGPTSVTNGLSQTTSYCYDYNTGLPTSTTDPNSQTTSTSYDDMLRTSTITYADTGQTTFGYPSPTEVQIGGSHNPAAYLLVDGLGREIARATANGESNPYDEIDTCYDALGRASFKSYPYQTSSLASSRSCSGAGDSIGYDAVSRTTTVTHSDGSYISTSYSGNSTTVTDEQSKTRESFTDGLGRLTQVVENPGGFNYTTAYTYDALDNLTGVSQVSSRNRSFTYDSLSRLTSAANPESGTTAYTYDANGNVVTKFDARSLTTYMSYDALNRLTQKTYSDQSGTATFGYDATNTFGMTASNPIGRMIFDKWDYPATGSQSSTWVSFSYDSMGRIASQANCFPSPIASCAYQANINISYDLLGDISSLNYPDGRVVKSYYNAGARPNQVTFDNFNGTGVGYNYLSGAHYAANGSPTSLTYGNGVVDAATYNARLQPATQTVTQGLSNWMSRAYNFYDGSGHDNGNVMGITDSLQGNRTQSFTYDALNRLATAQTTATSGADCWGQSYGYDAWGNLLQENVTQCSAPALSVGVGTNNQLTNSGFGYDLAGNMTHDASHAYVFDAEDRIATVDSGSSATYTYDAEGNRVQKQTGGVTTDYVWFGGEVLGEYNPSTADWSDYIYSNGHRIAKADTFENGIMLQGTNTCSSACAYTWYQENDAASIHGYTIQTGDKLYFRDYQVNARGGMGIFFEDGTNNVWHSTDQNGNYTNDDPDETTWDSRTIDLSSFAGKVIDWIGLDNDENGPSGAWAIVFGDISFVSADGTVFSIYSASPSFSVSLAMTSGTSGLSASNRHISNIGWATFSTTNYYHGDHLASSRLITSYGGWPVWSGTYLPLGQEWNPQSTVNHYKFTGKERDSESNLDNFGARYDSSSLGRFMSPDPLLSSGRLDDPQTWNRYAYTSNNPLNTADPTGLFDCKESQGGGTDEKYIDAITEQQCDNIQKQLNNARAAALTLFGQTGDIDQYNQTTAAINSYGNENEHNGVFVGSNKGYESITILNNDDTIQAGIGDKLKGDEYIVSLVHEGEHIAQANWWLDGGESSTSDLPHFVREAGAWTVSSYMAQALGMKSYAPHGGGSEMQVWNKGWKAADIQTLRSRGIGNVIKYMDERYPGNGDQTYSMEHHHQDGP